MSRTRPPGDDSGVTSLIGIVLALTLLVGAIASVALLVGRTASSPEGDEYVQSQEQLAERTLEALLASAGEPTNWEETGNIPTRVGFQVDNENGTGDLAKLGALRDLVQKPYGDCPKSNPSCLEWRCVPNDVACDPDQTLTGRMNLADKNVRLTARPVANDAIELPPTKMMYASGYDVDANGKPTGRSSVGQAEAGVFKRTNGGFTNRTSDWDWNWTAGVGTDLVPKPGTNYIGHWRNIQEHMFTAAAGIRAVDTIIDDASYDLYQSNGWKVVKFSSDIHSPPGGPDQAPDGDFVAASTFFDADFGSNGQWMSTEDDNTVMVLGPINLYGEGSAYLTFTHYMDTKTNPAKSAFGRVWAREFGTTGAWTHLATYEKDGGAWVVVDDEAWQSDGSVVNDGCYGGTPSDTKQPPADLTEFLGKRIELAFEWRNDDGTPSGDKDIRGWFIDNVKIGLTREEGGTCDPSTDIIYSNSFEPDPDRIPNLVFGSETNLAEVLADENFHVKDVLAALIEGGTNVVIMGQDNDPGDWLNTYGLDAVTWTAPPVVNTDHQLNVFPNNIDLSDASNYAAYAWTDAGAAVWDSAVNATTPADASLWVKVTPPQPGAGTIIATALKPGNLALGGGADGKKAADQAVENTLGAFYFSSMLFDVGQPLPNTVIQPVGSSTRTLTFPVFETGGPRTGVRFTLHVWD